jgi:hypothetical protein
VQDTREESERRCESAKRALSTMVTVSKYLIGKDKERRKKLIET